MNHVSGEISFASSASGGGESSEVDIYYFMCVFMVAYSEVLICHARGTET